MAATLSLPSSACRAVIALALAIVVLALPGSTRPLPRRSTG